MEKVLKFLGNSFLVGMVITPVSIGVSTIIQNLGKENVYVIIVNCQILLLLILGLGFVAKVLVWAFTEKKVQHDK